ncbi:MAG: CoA-binding protein [Armatimonadota bacterium]
MIYNVAVLGASTNPERYSYKAVKMLAEHDYGVFPVHPSEKPIGGVKCYSSLSSIPEPIDTITIYLSERNSTPLIEEIIGTHPRRVILNPGAYSYELEHRCEEVGIQVQEMCTLVMLKTGQF